LGSTSPKTRQSSNVYICEPVLKGQLPVVRSKRKSKSMEKNNTISSGIVLPISRCLRLMELTDNTCKWPLGDPFGKDFSFCGSD
ncbi:hypothetical protein DJ468_00795, partial [Candidatus Liberibacter asiaticus]